jgi:hypothetical protein
MVTMNRSRIALLVRAVVSVSYGACISAAAAEIPVPEVFSPGVVSGPAHDAAPAFTPDGKTVYFSRSSAAGSTILVSRKVRDSWSTPQIAAFSGQWSDMEPAMAPSGAFMIFVSSRPPSSDGQPLDGFFNSKAQPGQGGNLWRVAREANGWSVPARLPDSVNRSSTIFAPSITADASLYFMEPDKKTGKFRLYRSQYRDGTYQTAEPVSFSDGSSTDVDPAVAPDESFIVFGSGREPAQGMDLFIAFREHGRWGAPVHMGTQANSPGSDAEARLSPDCRTLYFSSERTMRVHFPRTREQAERDLSRIQSWDNGQYNIWWVSLASWLEKRS